MGRKILVLELWGIGDLTFSTVLLQKLAERGDTVHLLGKVHARQLLEQTFPNVHFFSFDADWTKFHGKYRLWNWKWRAFLALLRRLRDECYDAAVSVRNDPRDHFLMWLIDAKHRYGFPCDGSGLFLNLWVRRSRQKIQHKVEDWQDIGTALGCAGMPETKPYLEHAKYNSERVDALLKPAKKPVFCLHVGARIAVRRWKEHYYKEIIRKLREVFDFFLVLVPDLDGFGSQLAPHADAVASDLSLYELVDLLGRVDLLLCPDSAPGHIASACGKPVIAFFGPTDPVQFCPYGPHHKVLIRDICQHRPCFDYCRFPEPYCMTMLTPDEVWPEVREHVMSLAKRGVIPTAAIRPTVEAIQSPVLTGWPVRHQEETRMEGISILQIFSRYLQMGGEESSVYRIGDALMENHVVEYYTQSTAKMLSEGRLPYKADALGTVLHNAHAVRDLRRMQDICKFDIWQIHNVMPTLSPAVYKEAFRANIPVVHYLHNYRMGCINGFFLDHGKPCRKCQHGNFFHSVKAKCWHESHFICGWMNLVMKRIKALDVFQNIPQWIAISEAQKAAHVEMGIPAERIDVIHHFYEPKGEAPPLPDNGYALFLGRLSPEKGCMDLLKAWQAMPRERNLVVAGDGPELPALRKFAAETGLANVKFVGYVPREKQEALWLGAAFLVVPSRWMEPFGMVVLEAFAHGRAVVATNMGGLPELIVPGKTGLLVPPFSTEALASEMERLFQNPDLLQTMSTQARRELESRFSKKEWISKIENVYTKVLNSRLCTTKS